MKLYHGSNVKVENVDLGKSRPAKDFGVLSIFRLR